MITLQLKRTAKSLSDSIVNSYIPDVGEPFLLEVDTNSSVNFIGSTCVVPANNPTKIINLKEEDYPLFEYENRDGNLYPKVGCTLFVKFTYGNGITSPKASVHINNLYSTISTQIAYKIDNEYYTDILHSIYNWQPNDTRVLTYDGNYWVIQIPSKYIDSPILFIGNGIDTIDKLYKDGTYIPVSKYISDDMIKNGSITINKLDPNIDLATKDAVQQISDALDLFSSNTEDNFNNIDNKINLNKIYFTTCDSVSSNRLKVVNVDGLSLHDNFDGLTLIIKFTYGVNIPDSQYLTIEVKNSDGTQQLISPKPIYIGDTRLNKVFYWQANDTLVFVYNANYLGDGMSERGVWNLTSTSASQIIANWCYNSDTTFINGGAIATGSITADKIAANSITSNEIAVGSLPSNVFSQDVQSVIGNLNQFKQQCASAGAVVAYCHSQSTAINKLAYVTEDTLNSINTTMTQNNSRMPLTGTSIVIHFDYKAIEDNLSPTILANGINFGLTTSDSESNNYFIAPIGFIYNGDFVNVGTYIPAEDQGQPSDEIQVGSPKWEAIMYYRWGANKYRTVMFDGEHWIISITTDYLAKLAEYCLNNNQTWIGGGTVITGTIVADQIQSGSIDTSKVSLVCYGVDNQDDVMQYGGFGAYTGSAGSTRTLGVWMYGSTSWGDTDGIPDFNVVLTNAGLLMNIKNGRIAGYSNKWRFDATSGLELGLNYGNISIGRDSNAENGISTLTIRGKINVPTSSSGLPTGSIYVDSGILKVVT